LKSFVGQWLIPESTELRARDSDDRDSIRWDGAIVFSLARTKKGALVVYFRNPDVDDGIAIIDAYNSFKELQTNVDAGGRPRYPQNAVAAFAEVLGEPYMVELDI
jgi:hypothetical protein